MTMGAAIDKRMEELKPETPIGIEVGIISHQASSVETSVNGFVTNLVESVLIVIAVLLFTMGLRSGVLIGAILILTVLATVMVMEQCGLIFERISLGAFIIALGCSVPFAQVASGIHTETEEAIFKRRNRLPCITAKCNPVSGTASAARLRIADKLEALAKALPAGYTCQWGGEYENSGDANSSLAGKIPSILAIMVMIVIMLFSSLKQTVAIFMTVPFILVGVVAGLLGFDQPFGFMALLGFLSLVGMEIKNAIVMMDEINAQLSAGAKAFDALVSSALATFARRLRAVSTFGLRQMPAARKLPSRHTKTPAPLASRKQRKPLRMPVARRGSGSCCVRGLRAAKAFRARA